MATVRRVTISRYVVQICHQAVQLGTGRRTVTFYDWEGDRRTVGKLWQPTCGDDLKVTCGLTACTPGSAPGPTVDIEYGRTLPFVFIYCSILLSFVT